ncbi:dihydrolipoamide acetyltransferase family protein [Solimonas terrae]|uniref:Dihydrolipoamide acetyltransferase component of pyruvate dehydrogenase complex n=1 Tax=Solimonas terrae TaxID=1396819 RepID=A0A6M2BM57_9GAMM|nr:dihydrolipoamide acetyltransferase family protein [Solimonas terrae]NGY03179.1 2-oxo acid dehydrogenase subunit E2 [Solimonas terrae]
MSTRSNQYIFKLPDIGEGIAESEIAQWHVAVGDTVEEDQQLVDMLTDKAAVELSSPVAGRVLTIHGAAGDKIAVGGALVTLETDTSAGEIAAAEAAPAAPAAAETGAATGAPTQTTSAAVASKGDSPASSSPRDSVAASPATRKRARELGVDIAMVTPTGASGRVSRDDVERHASGGAVATRPAPAARSHGDDDAIEQIKVIGLRRKIAEAMQRSKQRIPHFAYVEEVDVTELEALRQHLNATHKERGKLTLLPLLIQALARAIPEFPQVNATYDDEAGIVTRHRALHVGIAAQTPNGLIVPVLKHAQRLDMWSRATEIRRLAEAARTGKATRDELSGSTITITSLGALGGIVTTPVINAPEVAIVGVNKLVERPVVKNGQIVVRSMMNLSSSFDHRIVDGFDAASFIQRVKALLEHPATLFIE